ncbi:MAG: hypothetical protein FWE12_05835 [Oscillospiraceae bacterium]|nr:hypothetical protein [Oscillospiraceae bacterium]
MRQAVKKLLDSRLVYLLISLIAAFTLWLWVVNSVNPSESNLIDFQIRYEGVGVLEQYNLRLASNTPETVRMWVTASATDMIRLEQNPQIIVDVSTIQEPGEHDMRFILGTLMTGNVTMRPIGGTGPLISNTNDTIVVRTNRVTARTIQLGTAGIRYEIAETEDEAEYRYIGDLVPTIEPEAILIDGPEEILARITNIEIEVDFPEPLMSTTTMVGTLRVYDYEGELMPEEALADVIFSRDTVTVTVAVSMVRSVPILPVFEFGAGANEENMRYTLSQEAVWLIGDADVLRNLEYLSLGLIRLDRRESMIDSVRRSIPVPALTEVFTGPAYVDVGIEIIGVSERTMHIPRERATIANPPAGTDPRVAIDTITLLIRGPEAILAELDESDISILINLAGYDGRLGWFNVEDVTVRVSDWPPEIVGAVIRAGQGVAVDIQRA